jgi:hypothetical protein
MPTQPQAEPIDPQGRSDETAVDRRYLTTDKVPWTGSWQPHCQEEPRRLKAGKRFPRCSSKHRKESWILLKLG